MGVNLRTSRNCHTQDVSTNTCTCTMGLATASLTCEVRGCLDPGLLLQLRGWKTSGSSGVHTGVHDSLLTHSWNDARRCSRAHADRDLGESGWTRACWSFDVPAP